VVGHWENARALDLYVMPVWRFKVGDFRSPIEVATGGRPRIVTADGIEERPAAVRWYERWRAKRQVAAIRKAVGAANRTTVQWRDDGDAVDTKQSTRSGDTTPDSPALAETVTW
jgi:hypothetical protein